jgi:phosphoenolpyruvate-protein kinase (PTS system EI component)
MENGLHPEAPIQLQATPFVPGRAKGILQRGTTASGPAVILVVTQQDLKPMASRPAGLIVLDGAPLSHPMIRLMGLGVPTVIIPSSEATALAEGTEVILDGRSGLITAAGRDKPWRPPGPPPYGVPVTSINGVTVELRASVADAQHTSMARAFGATAIGLVRSEYLIPPAGRVPDAGFFEGILSELFEAAAPLNVNVRLVDVATDKKPPWLGSLAAMCTPLGLQGPRLYGMEPMRSAVAAQIEALGRLQERFPVRVLLPYTTSLEEFEYWKTEIHRIAGLSIPVGVMAETPAGALLVAEWFQVAEIVGIGCNDLMQCLFGADRDLPELRRILDPYSPLVFRFLREIAHAAGERAGEIQLCGILSQVPHVLPILLGLGYRVFSVEPASIPFLAQEIEQTDVGAAAALARQVCAAGHVNTVRELLGIPPNPGWKPPAR